MMDNFSIFLLDFFSIGAFAMFLMQSVYLLLRGKHNKARRVLSYVYFLFGLACLARILVFQLKIYPSEFPYFNINTIVLGSFIIILTFLYPIEVITPGWLNKKRTAFFFLPITVVTAFYFLVLRFTHQDIEHICSYGQFVDTFGHFNVWFRLVFVLLSTIYIVYLITMIFKSEKRYERWKNNMYADRETMDVSWMCYYATFIILIYLAWLANIFWGNPWCVIVHSLLVIFSSCFLFYKAIFHESPYPENYFLHSLNERQADEMNAGKIVLPADTVQEISDRSFTKKVPEYVRMLTEWMEVEKPYLYKDFKLTDVSRVLPLNRSYLSRVFNEGFGRSFSEVVRTYRIEYAKVVLKEHVDLSLNEVAKLCGFTSDTIFIRAFNKVEQMTPIEYKEKYRMSNI